MCEKYVTSSIQNGHLHAPHQSVQCEYQAIVTTAVSETFHDERRRKNVRVCATKFLGKRGTQDSEFRALLPVPPGEFASALPVSEPGIQFAPGEFDDRAPVFQLFVGPGEVRGSEPHVQFGEKQIEIVIFREVMFDDFLAFHAPVEQLQTRKGRNLIHGRDFK